MDVARVYWDMIGIALSRGDIELARSLTDGWLAQCERVREELFLNMIDTHWIVPGNARL